MMNTMIPKSTNATKRVLTKLREVVATRSVEPNEDSFFVADIGVVQRQVALWRKHLPNVHPFYAVKCNGDPTVLACLAEAGLGFDCASRREIETVLATTHIKDPQYRIVYANTVKTPSYLRYAANVGVNRLTFDNVDELHKIAKWHPKAELLLRIATDDSGATCQLSNKFGCPPIERDLSQLLEEAARLGLHVTGVAFHIGSGGGTASNAYLSALRDARRVFSLAETWGHKEMKVLDIGGGFDADAEAFVTSAAQIRSGIQSLDFCPDLEVIAEPGRFFVADAFTLCTHVIGRRTPPRQSKEKDMLYITDGVYGNLNCIIYDHQTPRPQLLLMDEASDSTGADVPVESSVWGPTCDGIDVVSESTVFPRRVNIGDWLYFEGVGAYTLAASTTFNGFCHETEVHYT